MLTTADIERDAFDQLPFMIQQRYRRDRKLGSGGMGVVYRYYDEKLDRFLAVKALAPERAIDPLWRERFLHEAKTLAALVHQNIGAIFGDLLDEQGSVRKHVAVFINAQMIPSRTQLDIELRPQDKVMVIQALTGG